HDRRPRLGPSRRDREDWLGLDGAVEPLGCEGARDAGLRRRRVAPHAVRRDGQRGRAGVDARTRRDPRDDRDAGRRGRLLQGETAGINSRTTKSTVTPNESLLEPVLTTTRSRE